MTVTRWVAVLALAGLLLAGCRRQTETSSEQMQPPSGPVSDEARARIIRLAPDTLIGDVVAVAPEMNMAAVTQLPVQKVAVGDAITFVNEDAQPLTHGVIVRIGKDTVDVHYEPAPAGGRNPVVGDLALRFKTSTR